MLAELETDGSAVFVQPATDVITAAVNVSALDGASAEPAACAAAAAVLVCAHVAQSEEVELPVKHSSVRAPSEYPDIVNSKPSPTCVNVQSNRH